jgi:alkanesulfonate monooxygenase SsuD/methylene tetrahydromethanopterin reductase-like flavin-dependent oxidoreductase (luciferase family)
MTKIGKERGWPPTTRSHFEAQVGAKGALLVGSHAEVAEKIIRHSDAFKGHFKGNLSIGYGGIIAYSHYGMY